MNNVKRNENKERKKGKTWIGEWYGVEIVAESNRIWDFYELTNSEFILFPFPSRFLGHLQRKSLILLLKPVLLISLSRKKEPHDLSGAGATYNAMQLRIQRMFYTQWA
jgi:hypothetical protein